MRQIQITKNGGNISLNLAQILKVEEVHTRQFKRPIVESSEIEGRNEELKQCDY